MKNFTKIFISIFYIGYIKFAPGTWGTLASLLIMFFLLWLIMDFHEGKSSIKIDANFLILIILSITIIAGSIVAGMDAGLMYNTYPLMNGKFFPDQYGELGYLDPFENPGSAQFHHRHLGLITLLSFWSISTIKLCFPMFF